MTRRQADDKIAQAIYAHHEYKASWTPRTWGFAREMVSKRGKVYSRLAYEFEVQKHMVKTIRKIREIIESEAV